MTIRWIIKRDGTVEVDVEGGEKQNCLMTEEIEQLLGNRIGERDLKPEFSQGEVEGETERIQERE